jgi:cobalt-zinc-cadmium resistance protein CzcA
MLVTLFLTRYLMPVLYSFFPAPAGHAHCETDLILGSHYTDRFLKDGSSTAADAADQQELENTGGPDFAGQG